MVSEFYVLATKIKAYAKISVKNATPILQNYAHEYSLGDIVKTCSRS